MPAADRQWPLWWAGWVLFVVYGSLLPFDFHPLPLAEALERFRHIPFLQLGIDSRADWVANGVLYLPVGALSAHGLVSALRGRVTTLAVLLAIVFGVALAFGVEFAQEFFPPRTVSQNDLIAESVGTVLGALAAPWLLPSLRRLGSGWRIGGVVLVKRALQAYAVGYVALSFFPYDLLLDAAEWHDKLASDLCGWWLAGPTRERGWLGLLLLGVEVALSAPFGVLLACKPRERLLSRAALLGLLLGVAIEGGQLAIASGVSQGVSVLSRVAGVVLGAWIGAQGTPGLAGIRKALQPHLLALQIGHAVLVLAASGWLGHGLRSLAQAQAQWAELRLMPFYYHYYTSEAEALFSLGSVGLMYLPVALLGRAAGRPAGADMALAMALALVNEAGKLWLDGLHPDPTNVFIAVAVCAVARELMRRASAVAVVPQADAVAAALPQAPGIATWALALGAAGVAMAQALTFPVFALPLAGLLAAGCAAVALRPAWALAILPAAMPVLDLAPFSGRLLWDEFDILQLALLAVAWLRTRPTPAAPRPPSSAARTLAWSLLASSLGVSLLRGSWPGAWSDAGSLANAFGPGNALRIGKGALWALALIALMRRLPADARAQQRLLAGGLCVGLGLTLAVVVWERAAFVGLFDFESDYRVTGPFSAMHTGGATIECFLAVATAVAMATTLQLRQVWSRLAMLLLLVVSSYAMMVTYSRNGYAALLAAVAVVALAMARRAGATWRNRLGGGVVAVAMFSAAVPILLGGFAQQRLAQSAQDFEVRLAHWRDALSLRDDSAFTLWLGAGLGRFPELHFWRSAEPVHAGLFRLDADASGPLLRLGAGAAIYVEQVVDVAAGQRLQLTLSQRAARGAQLSIALCEKWLLTSAQCARIEPGPVHSRGGWLHGRWLLDTTGWAAAPPGLGRPVKLALFHGSGEGTIDVSKVQLSAEDGTQLLANGDFARGLDRWFFTTDVDPPWHIHSWPVTVLLEQGWLGVLAWSWVLALALSGASRRAWQGDPNAAGLLAAVVAFAVSGLVNTLTDAPRLLWLWCLLLWLGASTRPSPPAAALPGRDTGHG